MPSASRPRRSGTGTVCTDRSACPPLNGNLPRAGMDYACVSKNFHGCRLTLCGRGGPEGVPEGGPVVTRLRTSSSTATSLTARQDGREADRVPAGPWHGGWGPPWRPAWRPAAGASRVHGEGLGRGAWGACVRAAASPASPKHTTLSARLGAACLERNLFSSRRFVRVLPLPLTLPQAPALPLPQPARPPVRPAAPRRGVAWRRRHCFKRCYL